MKKEMDRDKIRKEFNEFIDTASDQTLKKFLALLKKRRAEKSGFDPKHQLPGTRGDQKTPD